MSVTTVRLGGRPDQPLLLLGPAAGAAVQTLWSATARLLASSFQVVGWDLPGHGTNRGRAPLDDGSFPALSIASLARDLAEALDLLLDTAPGAPERPVHYVGHGLGGLVGVRLAHDLRHPVASLTLTGDCFSGSLRDQLLADAGIEAERILPDALVAVRRAQDEVDPDRLLGDLSLPVLAVVGADDPGAPARVAAVLDLAGVGGAHVEPLPGAGALPPLQAPQALADLIRDHVLGRPPHQEGLDALTEALLRLALAAGGPEATDETGVRRVTEAARQATRSGASTTAVAHVLELAWGERDVDGGLTARVIRSIEVGP